MTQETQIGIDESKDNPSAWQLTMLVLCAYALAAIFVDTIYSLPKEISALLMFIDNIICIFFLADFFWNLFTAKSKLDYMKWGWIDLISSIPYLPFLRFGRILRIIRILRGLRSAKFLLSFIYTRRADNAFMSITLFTIIMVIFSSIAILNVENAPEANIKTAEDALWWTMTTITTVGYGDKYPVTTEGRIVATILMITGVGLFGTFTAFIASQILNPAREKEDRLMAAMKKEMDEIKVKIDNMAKK